MSTHPTNPRTVETRDGAVVVRIPMDFKKRGGRKQIVAAPESGEAPAEPQRPLVQALAQAHLWQRWLDDGTEPSLASLADREGIHRSYVGRVLRLASLAPDIVDAILHGREPSALSLVKLLKATPTVWDDQRLLIGPPN